MTARYFRTAQAFRDWLEKHHEAETELLVGFYKKSVGKGSITYQQALDEALAVGWIDGVRRGVDAERYTIRFTPRKTRSIWSAVNIKRVGELIAAGQMKPTGLAAFAKRDEKRSAIYSYERGGAVLEGDALKTMKADKKAWAFYNAQAPWYQRTSAFWVVNAKKPETRARRLGILIDCSRTGERIDSLARSPKPADPATV